MKKLTLTLTDENSEIIKTWTLGDGSIEDMDVKPECDFYVYDELNSAIKIGGAVVMEALISFGRL